MLFFPRLAEYCCDPLVCSLVDIECHHAVPATGQSQPLQGSVVPPYAVILVLVGVTLAIAGNLLVQS